jgi:hypothetical protein
MIPLSLVRHAVSHIADRSQRSAAVLATAEDDLTAHIFEQRLNRE